MEVVVAQILGVVALVLVSIGYFFKDRFKFLLMQVIANAFYASAFLVVGAYVGGVITFISIARCLYIYFAQKYSFKYFYPFLLIFIVCYIVVTIVFWSAWVDIMPLITATIFTVGLSIKNLQTARCVFLIPNVILIVYNIFATTYASALLDFIEVVVIIVAIIKFCIENKRFKIS